MNLPGDAVVHVDPDRRAHGRRTTSLLDSSPGENYLRFLPDETAAGAIKLSPALPIDTLQGWGPVQFEFVSEHGVCKQLIVWWPRPAGGAKRLATLVNGELTSPVSVSMPAGQAPPAPIGEPAGYLIEPDHAIIAARGVDDLAAAYGLSRIGRQLAWLFGPEPIDTPLANCFEILAVTAGRQRDIRRELRKLDAGLVEIKTRGLKLNTDSLQQQLRGKGRQTLSVLWGRLGSKQVAFICRRV